MKLVHWLRGREFVPGAPLHLQKIGHVLPQILKYGQRLLILQHLSGLSAVGDIPVEGRRNDHLGDQKVMIELVEGGHPSRAAQYRNAGSNF